MDDLTEHELLARVGRGERDALGALYARHVRAVFRFALVETRSREEAEDLTHETFLTLATRAKRISLSTGSVLPWLLVTCRNLSRNRRRTIARESKRAQDAAKDAEMAVPQSVEEAAELNALRREVRQAIEALKPDDRQLFDLCIEQGISYQHAANLLGLSHAGVRNRLSRLRVLLRQSLASTQEVPGP